MQHQPMAQPRHDPVAIALFCFLVVRTGDKRASLSMHHDVSVRS